jgi:hypothetical protein
LAADRRDFAEEFPDFKKDSVSALRSRAGGGAENGWISAADFSEFDPLLQLQAAFRQNA